MIKVISYIKKNEVISIFLAIILFSIIIGFLTKSAPIICKKGELSASNTELIPISNGKIIYFIPHTEKKCIKENIK